MATLTRKLQHLPKLNTVIYNIKWPLLFTIPMRNLQTYLRGRFSRINSLAEIIGLSWGGYRGWVKVFVQSSENDNYF